MGIDVMEGWAIVYWGVFILNFIVPVASCVVAGTLCSSLMPRIGVADGMKYGSLIGLVTIGCGLAWTIFNFLYLLQATNGSIEMGIAGLILIATCGCIVTVLVCHNRDKRARLIPIGSSYTEDGP